MLLSDLRRDYLKTQIIDLSLSESAEHINRQLEALQDQALAEFAAENIDGTRIRFMRYGRCRYQNQEHSVEISLPDGEIHTAQLDQIVERFRSDYDRNSGK